MFLHNFHVTLAWCKTVYHIVIFSGIFTEKIETIFYLTNGSNYNIAHLEYVLLLSSIVHKFCILKQEIEAKIGLQNAQIRSGIRFLDFQSKLETIVQ